MYQYFTSIAPTIRLRELPCQSAAAGRRAGRVVMGLMLMGDAGRCALARRR